jgi:hypothetical protein
MQRVLFEAGMETADDASARVTLDNGPIIALKDGTRGYPPAAEKGCLVEIE